MIQIRHLQHGNRPVFEPEPPPADSNPYHLSAERMRNPTLAEFSALVAEIMRAQGVGRRAASQQVAERRPQLYDAALEALSQ